ncbi:MAG: type 1 glutamine amidotransferase [Bacillota bacterium]|jgi:putative glutamine amidotransferase
MKPLIAIACKHRETANEVCIGAGYNVVVLESGGIPLLLAPGMDEALLDEVFHYCRGLLLPGGNDIDPGLYGGKRMIGEMTAFFERKQDDFDMKLIRLALTRNLPILAIGRGMQLINVILGGTLYQDLSHDYPNAANHQSEPNHNLQMHRVILRSETRLIELLGKEILTNSNHHQAVRELGGCLVISGMSTDGIIEAIEYSRSDRWIVGVQWHPELSNITSMQPLLREFISQAEMASEEKF